MTDTSKEAVERIAEWVEAMARVDAPWTCEPGSGPYDNAGATLRALLAERDTWREACVNGTSLTVLTARKLAEVTTERDALRAEMEAMAQELSPFLSSDPSKGLCGLAARTAMREPGTWATHYDGEDVDPGKPWTPQEVKG